MNTKNTWGLVAAAAALFAFIFFVERPGTRPAKPADHKLLPGLQVALISRIEIKHGTNQVIVERTNDTWRLVAPVSYPAMQNRIKDFLDRASKLVWTGTISAADLAKSPNGLVDYGLQPPLAQFALIQNTQRLEVKIGEQTLADGQRYVQVGDEVLAYLVDERIGSILPLTANSWRDTYVLPQNGFTFNRVEVRTGQGIREFQRDETNQLWRITKPIAARADNVRFKDWLRQLRAWNIYGNGFVDNPAPTLDTGLSAPELALVLAQGTNEVFGLQFGNHITNNVVYARRSQHSNVVVLADQLLEPLRGSPNEFRDRRLLTFPPASVDLVKVQSEESFTLQRQTNGTWRVLEQTNFVVDTALANEMLLNLNGLDVFEFVKDVVTDWMPYGLSPAVHQYQLFHGGTNLPPAGTDALVAELDLGRTTAGTIFARRPDEASVYSLTEIEAKKLPRSLYQLRDRRVWNFTTNEVKRVIIEQDGRKRELVKNSKGTWSMAPGTQGILNPFAVEETLYRLGELRAVKWLPRTQGNLARYGITAQSHALTLVLDRDGKEQRLGLRLGSLTPTRDVYAAVVLDDTPVLFELPQALHDYLTSYLNAPPPPGAAQ